jgi:arylsulfatase A-like enzyme
MQALEETGQEKNTLVFFTSDNGGALRYEQRNEPLRGGKQDMFEGGIRVPAFATWKGQIQPGSETDNVGLLMDLYPTFCNLAQARIPGDPDGLSLLPTLMGKPQVTDDRMLFWMRREGGSRYGGQAYYAARYREHKILQNTPTEEFQFFNLVRDPYETTPLPVEGNADYQKLRSALQEHIRQTGSIPWQN